MKLLVRDEMELAKSELIPAAKNGGMGGGLFGAAGYFGISALSILYFAAAFGLVALWTVVSLAFLIVGVALLLIAGICAGIGLMMIKKVKAAGAHHRAGQQDGDRGQGRGPAGHRRRQRAADRGHGRARAGRCAEPPTVRAEVAGAGVRDILLDGPWRHRDIAANGIRFHVAVGEHFSPARPLILLLHGFGEFWWAWRGQIPALDAAGFSVAAMDLRGYGASDKTPRGYDPHTTAYDISGVIKSLGSPPRRSSATTGAGWRPGPPRVRARSGAGPDQRRRSASAGLSLAAEPAHGWRSSSCRCSRAPDHGRRRLFIERLLRSRAADPDAIFTSAEARHYRDALMLWPSPHCAMEYQRMFIRDQFRGGGRDYRRALRQRVTVPLLSIHGELDQQVPWPRCGPPTSGSTRHTW